jgi:serine/threonine protein kinase
VRTLGAYDIEAFIAEGGMGEVYLARRRGVEGFSKRTVLKCLREELSEDPALLRLFTDEAKLSATLDHPAIVHVYELGCALRRYYIAMEYVPGIDLATLLRGLRESGERLEPDLALYIFAQLVSALGYAHEKSVDGRALQIVHRDVSPQNVLLSSEGLVKLSDFGIAKAAGRAHKTKTGALHGKLSYMAPEQARGAAVDRRADLFSAAIIAFEMLSGQRLYAADDELTLLALAQHAEIPPLSRLAPQVPKAAVAVIEHALRRAPEDRLQSASAVLRALEESGALRHADAPARLAAYVARFPRVLAPVSDEESGVAQGPEPPEQTRTGVATHSKRRASRRGSVAAASLVLLLCSFAATAWFAAQGPRRATPTTPRARDAMTSETTEPALVPSPSSAPASALRVGYLSLSAKPWARVFIDGVRQKDTPVLRLPLPVGRHKVRLFWTQYRTEKFLDVDIETGANFRALVSAEGATATPR